MQRKQATKKTRKGVNDECDGLERELRDQQAAELLELETPTTTELRNPHIDPLADGLDQLAINAESQVSSSSIQQPESPPSAIASQSASTDAEREQQDEAGEARKKKPNRARERMARRQAEQEALFAQAEKEASDIPNLKKQERDRMLAEFGKRSLREKIIRADGHCLYSAVADQLGELGVPLQTGDAPATKPRISFLQKQEPEGAGSEPYRQVRRAAATYIEGHADDFAPFLEEPLDQYVHKIRDTGEWGGQLELLALAKTYGVRISVLQGDGRVEEIDGGNDEDKRIWLAYYRHGFGLGEHYNSLHKV